MILRDFIKGKEQVCNSLKCSWSKVEG